MVSGGKKRLAVCLVSGGMDSCVSATVARKDYDLALLHLNYGQLTEERELKAFNDIADFFNVPDVLRIVINIDHLKRIGGSSLTDTSIVVSDAHLDSEKIPSTYVPFRNANILAMAVSWAEVIGAQRIFIGAMEEDASGYPDCREVFYKVFNKVIELGTRPDTEIMIETPIIHMTKAEVAKWGMENGAPLHLSWSCYTSTGPKACGVCDSCALRLRGFQRAGFEDPINYEERPDYA